MLSFLYKRKAEPNVIDRSNVSAIVVAAIHGFANAVKVLAEASADLKLASDDPCFTLQGACVRSGTPGVLQVLEDIGIHLSKRFATMKNAGPGARVQGRNFSS